MANQHEDYNEDTEQYYYFNGGEDDRNEMDLDNYFGQVLFQLQNARGYRPPRLPRVIGGERGDEFVHRILYGNRPDLCKQIFRLNTNAFHSLVELLRRRGNITEGRELFMPEILAISLYIFARGASYRDIETRFQRSKSTVSHYHNQVINALCKLSKHVIRPYRDQNALHQVFFVDGNEALFPFKNAIGALDGTHIQANINDEQGYSYYDRHGNKSFNVLAIVDFDGRIVYVSAGWEGSVHDVTVLRSAIAKDQGKFPHPGPGKYYLVDSGYPNTEGYLAPFRGVEYHPPQFRRLREAGVQNFNYKRNYNKKHSKLRGTVERVFGEMKATWKILKRMPEAPIPSQVSIIIAVCTLHNIIKMHKMGLPITPNPNIVYPEVPVGEHSTRSMDVLRRNIAGEVHQMVVGDPNEDTPDNPFYVDEIMD